MTRPSERVESGEVESGELESGEVESGELESGEVESGELESEKVESGEVHPNLSFLEIFGKNYIEAQKGSRTKEEWGFFPLEDKLNDEKTRNTMLSMPK